MQNYPLYNSKESIKELVVHQDKMLLLDKILHYDLNETSIETAVNITHNSMFYDKDIKGVPSYVAFEYMAQSIAALSGIFGKSKNEKPKAGFIMSISNFKAIIPTFLENETVRISVKETVRIDTVVTFEGTAFVNDKPAVTSTLNAIEVKNPKESLGL